MREICTSGLMSGDGKRGGAPASVLAPILDSTRQVLILEQELLVYQTGHVPKAARMWLCSSSTSIIEDRDPSTHSNILTLADTISTDPEKAQRQRDCPCGR